MYDASELFKRAIAQKNRDVRISCTIDGIEYEGTDIQSCSIEEDIMPTEDFAFGSANASKLSISLMNMGDFLSAKSYEGKEIEVKIGVQLDKFSRPFEYVPMGIFIVEKARIETNIINLDCTDRMIIFEKEWEEGLTFPASLDQILVYTCTRCGIELETTTFTNSDYVVSQEPDLEGKTYRQIVGAVAELACTFANIGRNGKLKLISLIDTDTVISEDNYYSMILSEYDYGPITKVVVSSDGIETVSGSGENLIHIKDNILAKYPTQVLVDNLLDASYGIAFKPFTSTWQGNPMVSIGDKIKVSYRNRGEYLSFIAKQKFTFDTGLKSDISTEVKTKNERDYQSSGIITGEIKNAKAEFRSKLERMDNRITLEVEEVNASIATLEIKADNIQLGVTQLNGRMGNAESQLTIQAGQIQSKVSLTDYNGQTVTSLITQDPYSISWLANNLNLQGLVTFTNLNTPGSAVIDGGNIYGSLFQVGRGTGSTLTMTAIAGSHSIQSNDAYGFRLGSNGSLSLSAGSGYGIYATGAPLVAQSGFRVDGGTSQFNTNVTVNATLNASYLQIQGSPVATQAWVLAIMGV